MTKQIQRISIFFVFLCALTSIWACKTQKVPKKKVKAPDFLFSLKKAADFELLQGEPLTEKYGNVTSIKVVMPRKMGKVYFCNSQKYQFHFEFCFTQFAGSNDLHLFNSTEYSNESERRFLLGNLNYYQHQDIYTLELFADDQARPEWITQLYDSVAANIFCKDKLRLFINSSTIEKKMAAIGTHIRTITANDLYANQVFQSLHKGVAFGYLRKVPSKDFEQYNFSAQDIILTDGLPNNFPLVQGMLTSVFQTPLCHINILSSHRGTPNAALKTVLKDQAYMQLVDQLVRYEVTTDSILLRSATLKEAEDFWKKRPKPKTINLAQNLTDKTLLSLDKIKYSDANRVGGKAANFAELMTVRTPRGEKIPMPEGAFAIPLSWYHQHIEQHKLQPFLKSILVKASAEKNTRKRAVLLKQLQDTIKHCALDTKLLDLVEKQLKMTPQYTDFRFRSSTNAEDIDNFNGAGLYTSKTGSLTNKDKKIADAIRKVWASTWSLRAFDERQHANINQLTVGMGILVHRAFGDEAANGVAITRHLYRDDYPSFTINVQEGETSVVLPSDSVVCDQFILHHNGITGKKNLSLEYITKSSLTKGRAVMDLKEIRLLSEYLTAIKEHFYHQTDYGKQMNYNNFAMDIEFKLEQKTRKLYIKQARPFN